MRGCIFYRGGEHSCVVVRKLPVGNSGSEFPKASESHLAPVGELELRVPGSFRTPSSPRCGSWRRPLRGPAGASPSAPMGARCSPSPQPPRPTAVEDETIRVSIESGGLPAGFAIPEGFRDGKRPGRPDLPEFLRTVGFWKTRSDPSTGPQPRGKTALFSDVPGRKSASAQN